MAGDVKKFIQRQPVPEGITTLMASALATEMPDPATLSDDEERIYTRRQMSKKGTDLYGVPVADTPTALAAAHETVQHYLTKEHIDEVLAKAVAQVDLDKDTTIHVAVPVKPDSSVNVLATAYAATLCHELEARAKEKGYEHLHFSDDKHLVMTSVVNRTFADAIGRLVKLPLFDTSAFKAGDKVILADDHIQSGGFFATAFSAFPADVDVLGVATLTRHPLSASLTVHPQVKAAFNALPDIDIVKAKLAEVGVSSDTLTDREALTVIAAMSSPENKPQFEALLDIAGRDSAIEAIEKKDDSLNAIFMQPAMSAREFVAAMENAIPEERKVRGGAHG